VDVGRLTRCAAHHESGQVAEVTADRASVVSLVLVDTADGWRVAAFQNTRVQERGR
jgi:hypothetical protein